MKKTLGLLLTVVLLTVFPAVAHCWCPNHDCHGFISKPAGKVQCHHDQNAADLVLSNRSCCQGRCLSNEWLVSNQASSRVGRFQWGTSNRDGFGVVDVFLGRNGSALPGRLLRFSDFDFPIFTAYSRSFSPRAPPRVHSFLN